MCLLVISGGCTGPTRPAPPSPSTVSAQPLRPRAGHTATLLADGRVLIAGGCAVDGCTTSEVEPSSEFFVPGRGFVPGPRMRHPRSSHSATLLADGRVLIVGGWAREGTEALAEAEMFDPVTGTFQPAGTMQGDTILLPDGRVLLAGEAEVKIFDPASGALTAGPAMPRPRHAASILLPDGTILITGGQDGRQRGLTSTVIYDPRNGQRRAGPQMATPRFKHAIALLDAGRVIVLGGTTDDSELLASTEILDLAANVFTPGPAMSVPRYKFRDVIVRTTAGRLVVAGGTRVDMLAADGRSFEAITEVAARRWVPTATALPDGTVLVVGGYDERIRVHVDAVITPVLR
ncbi:hypothetical protein Rhe02_07680 [Rhizocola hellebori]|uniref:Galactose oxidase n=1 Tax=Rhizocola hellebori TaxID=1392758 RepID=A0A8J3Q2Z8_9ACTN|nr:hypothetical protein Rhe02_07680 [Rhizocola hellebori]